jgi:UDP-glucose 4-epimerase
MICLPRVQPEYVFHLAAQRGSQAAVREAMLRIHVIGAFVLMRLVRKYAVTRLVTAGSSLEYAPSPTALNESSVLAPMTWHGATKAAANLLFRQAAAADGLPVVVLRLFHVFGPWESAHRLGPTAIRAAKSGAPMAVTKPGIRRDWVFVEDVCEALLLAVKKGEIGDVFNIGSGVETANEEFVACVESVTGCKIRLMPELFDPRVTDAEHVFADRRLAAKVLGWFPRHDLSQGVRRTIDWFTRTPWAWSVANDLYPGVL